MNSRNPASTSSRRIAYRGLDPRTADWIRGFRADLTCRDPGGVTLVTPLSVQPAPPVPGRHECHPALERLDG